MPRSVKHKCYIAGEFISTKSHHPVLNPYTSSTIGYMPVCDDALLLRAIDAAKSSFKSFAAMHRYERADILRKIQNGIAKDTELLSNMICEEGGKPISLAKGEVARAQVTSQWSAEEAVRFGGEWLPLDINPAGKGYTSLVGRVPVGVTLAISPFNFPINLIMHKLAPAIAVGCPVIIKPSSETPLTALRLAKICHEAGCPPGTVNVVPCRGPAFEKLVTLDDPRMLSFTGSADVGWRLKSIANRKRVALELGGNAAVVVHEDADLKSAAKRSAFGGFAHAGQICIGVQRIMVQDAVYEKFRKQFLSETRKLKSGDPKNPETTVGPMITPGEADRVESWVKEAVEAGAKVLLKGKRNGSVIEPIVLENVSREMKVYAKEVFGPVVCLNKYKSWDEAMAMVNDSIYGLQAGIFTSDISRVKSAYEKLDVGAIIVNDIPTIRVDNYPYGGTKESGMGREGIRCTMHEMTEEKVLVMKF